MSENLELRNGIYYLRIMIAGKLYRRTTGFNDIKLARRRAVEMENEIRAGNLGWIKPPVPRLDHWIERFLKAYHPDRTLEARLLARLTDALGTRQINHITRIDLEEYFRSREKDAAVGTLERERVLIKSVFRAAIDEKLLEDNPLARIRRYRPKPRTRTLTAEEEGRLRSVLPQHWQRWLTVMLLTGLRRGELAMARPCDIRQDGRYLWVRPESNKTRKDRLVPLREEALMALQVQAALRGITAEGRYWNLGTNTAHTTLQRMCERAHISPPISVHDLRRTFGTRCAQAGMHPPHLQAIMGHTDLKTTMTYYVHLAQMDIRDALLKLTL